MEVIPTFVTTSGTPVPDDLIAQKLEEERERRRKRSDPRLPLSFILSSLPPLLSKVSVFLFLPSVYLFSFSKFEVLEHLPLRLSWFFPFPSPLSRLLCLLIYHFLFSGLVVRTEINIFSSYSSRKEFLLRSPSLSTSTSLLAIALFRARNTKLSIDRKGLGSTSKSLIRYFFWYFLALSWASLLSLSLVDSSRIRRKSLRRLLISERSSRLSATIPRYHTILRKLNILF